MDFSHTNLLDFSHWSVFVPPPLLVVQEVRAIIIIRESTKLQSKKHRPKEQERWGKEIAKKKGYKIVKMFNVVESGKTFLCNYKDKILKIVKEEKANLILVRTEDRWTRNLKDSEILVEALRKEGCTIIETEKRTYDLDDYHARYDFQNHIAESERWLHVIRSTTAEGREGALRQRIWPFGKPPPGVRVASVTRKMYPCEETKRWGPEAFKFFKEKKSLTKTAKMLKEKFGVDISRRKLRVFLTHPLRKGIYKLKYDERIIEVPLEEFAIVDCELFEDVQNILNANKKNRKIGEILQKKLPDNGYDLLANLWQVFGEVILFRCRKCLGERGKTAIAWFHGTEAINGALNIKLKCSECGYQFRIPLAPPVSSGELVPVRCIWCGVGVREKLTVHLDGDYEVKVCSLCEDGFIPLTKEEISSGKKVQQPTPAKIPVKQKNERSKVHNQSHKRTLWDFLQGGTP
jgi:DNA invertase Pin-like site-specific DNA recombinase